MCWIIFAVSTIIYILGLYYNVSFLRTTLSEGIIENEEKEKKKRID